MLPWRQPNPYRACDTHRQRQLSLRGKDAHQNGVPAMLERYAERVRPTTGCVIEQLFVVDPVTRHGGPAYLQVRFLVSRRMDKRHGVGGNRLTVEETAQVKDAVAARLPPLPGEPL